MGIIPGSDKLIIWDAPGPINFLTHRVKVVAEDGFAIDIQSLVDQVDSNRMKSDLLWLAQERTFTPGSGLNHLTDVKDSMEAVFLGLGLESYRQEKALQNYTIQNIIGRKEGVRNEARTYAVDAHFDGVGGTDAADDNGSGTIGVWECARILSQYEFAYSLRFIGFDQEETGLQGSIEYVTNGIPVWEDFRGTLNFEMIGYYDDAPNSQTLPSGFDLLFPVVYNQVAQDSFRGNFITNIANDDSDALRQTYDSCAAAYVPALITRSLVTPVNGALTPDLLRSDHAPFWQTGYPALFLTDGAEFRNQNYHTVGDSIETLDFGFMQQVVKAAIATLASLAQPLHAGYSEAEIELISALDELKEMCELQLWKDGETFYFELGRPDCLNSELEIQLLDLSGKKVRDAKITFSQNRYGISTTDLAAGVYLWVFRSSFGTFSEKVLIR